MKLRPAQIEILKYRQGRMAINAVPGSGKTLTLAILASEIIAGGHVDVNLGQQILIVTYLNTSVQTFSERICHQLENLGLPYQGFDIRTLHSLALEIVSLAGGSVILNEPVMVADETQVDSYLALAVDSWIDANPRIWRVFLADDSPQMHVRWRSIAEKTARSFIRTAKNNRYRPKDLLGRLQNGEGKSVLASTPLDKKINGDPFDNSTLDFTLLWMLTGIYDRYQAILEKRGALDYDDLIWRAVDDMEKRHDLAETLRERWPYVLEDEAQDSVPLQETLLESLTGIDGNWVRVGDPNQAITSTFTAADPRFFVAFLERPGVITRPLPNSGRCSPLIFEAANTVVEWVCDNHPVQEVRQHAFHRQKILPTPIGDAQPNPPNHESDIETTVYRHREDEELPAVTTRAITYATRHPQHTVAILVPTNESGRHVADCLDVNNVDYDNLLRGAGRHREIAAALHAMLKLLGDPLNTRALESAHAALFELDHPAATVHEVDIDRIHTLLRSVHKPEVLLFPSPQDKIRNALPAGIGDDAEVSAIKHFADFLYEAYKLRSLPVNDMILALSDLLFSYYTGQEHEADRFTAYLIANEIGQWRDLQPEWRLPELAAQLDDIAEGRRYLYLARPIDAGFKPVPGRITLSTQHGAKGMEWDAVFIVGIDGFWIPGDLNAQFMGVHEFLGGDPAAEATAQLRYLMEGHPGLYPGRSATETAHIEIICERLRLLYVGITRSRRRLFISRSRKTRFRKKEFDADPATVLGVLYKYLSNRSS